MEETKPVGKCCCCSGHKIKLLVGFVGIVIVVCAVLAIFEKTSVFTKRTITVTGTATRQQVNQLASFNATVNSKNADKATAVADVTAKSEKLVADLKQFGIADKDLKTQSLNIYRDQTPYWDNGIQKFKDGDWNASISVDITLRDLTKSSDLTDLLAKSDTSNIYGPSYTLNEGESDKTQLLVTAFTNAQAKANTLANGMGMKVGKVKTVVEGVNYGSPVYAVKDAGMGGGGGGMEPGSSSVSSTLTVTFELR